MTDGAQGEVDRTPGTTDGARPAARSHLAVGSPAWRAEARRRQREALPDWDRVAVSCPAPVGSGGLGRHLEELAAAFAGVGADVRCVCEGRGPRAFQVPEGSDDTPQTAIEVIVPRPGRTGQALRLIAPLGRLSPAVRARLDCAAFDADAVRVTSTAANVLGFNGTSLRQLRAERARGHAPALVSANPHVRRQVQMHERAWKRHPVERPWSPGVLERTLREYELAETIHVSSRLIWESFVEAGFAEERLRMFPLTPAERYRPDPAAATSPTFDVVYAGQLTVDKGVPILVEAVSRLPHRDLRLRLVGGWRTPGMRRFVEAALRADARIEAGPGDPLPILQAARLYVHAAWDDGFGYSGAEAMACGVPVLVSEGTGMKDLVGDGGPGAILPTGDVDALAEAIDAVYRGEPLQQNPARPAANPTL